MRTVIAQINGVNISPENELLIKPPSQNIFDEHFNEATVNDALWDVDLVGAGSVTINNSFADIAVTTANGDSARFHSLKVFRHIFSQTISFRCGIVLDFETLADNTREWGMFEHAVGNGWFFRLLNGVLQACTIFDGAVTATNIDSFKPVDGLLHRYDAVYRNYKVVFIIDGVIVHTSEAGATALYNDERISLHFKNINTAVVSSAPTLKLEGCSIFDDSASSTGILGKDDAGNIIAVAVTAAGRILVSQEPTPAPPGATPVIRSVYSNVSTVDDNIYTITNETTLTIQRLAGTNESSTGGTAVELFEDPNGDLSVLNVISVVINGNGGGELNATFTGDGTRRIVMRRNRFDGGSRWTFARWEGFEE